MLIKLFFIYVITVNLIGFLLMGIDKKKAEKKAYRIPEKTLFGVAVIGGSIGTYLGMEFFRHKTKHRSFTLGLPAILLVQGVIIIWIARRYSL